MNKKAYIISGVIIILFVLVFLIPRPQTKTIKIGVILSETGAAAPWGEFGGNGVRLAAKMINAGGGIEGRPVEVIIEDDHTDPKQAVSAYQKLVSVDHVDAVIGGAWDFLAEPLIPLSAQNKIAFVSPSNFRIADGFELNDQSFVMLNDFDKTILKLQPFFASSTIKKLAVVHFKSSFGQEIAKTLSMIAKAMGKEFVDESYTQIGNNDFKTTILKLKNTGVDGVFLDMVGNDPVTFLKQARALGFYPTVITYNGALDSFGDAIDKTLLENIVVLNWQITTKAFANLYQKEYGILPTKSADKYFDAVYVLANAVAKSSGVAEYISKTVFETPNSTVRFTTDHAAETTPAEIQIIRNGKSEKVF